MTVGSLRDLVAAIAVAAVTMVAAAPAHAQLARSPRPYRALFGGAPDDGTSRQSLDLSGSLTGSYLSNSWTGDAANRNLFDSGSALHPTLRYTGYVAEGSGSLSYVRRWDPVTLAAGAGATLFYLPKNHTAVQLFSVSTTARYVAAPWNHAQFSFTPSAAFATYDHLGLLETADSEPNLVEQVDYGLLDRGRYMFGANADLTHTLSARSSMSLYSNVNRVQYVDRDAHFLTSRAGFRYTRQVTSHASAHFGYGYGIVTHDLPGRPRTSYSTHLIDVGVDYGRSLSFTRKTKFTFGTGSSVFGRDTSTQEPRGDFRTRASLTGNMQLIHEIGRSWRAQAHYARGVRFIEGIGDPVFSNSASASIGGYVGPRVDLSAVAAYSRGSFGSWRSGRGYATYTASGQIRYAIARHLAAYAQYGYHHLAYDGDVSLLDDIPQRLDRKIIRAGLQLSGSLPLLR